MALKRVTSREAAAADMCREGCFNVEASSTALKKILNIRFKKENSKPFRKTN